MANKFDDCKNHHFSQINSTMGNCWIGVEFELVVGGNLIIGGRDNKVKIVGLHTRTI